MSFVPGREEVEHEARADEIPTHVHGVARARVGGGGGDRVALLDDRGEVVNEAEAESHGDETRGRVRLHASRAGPGGVQRVADAPTRVQSEPALLREDGIEREQDL